MGLSLSPAREGDLGIWKLINAKEENYYANKILLSYGSMIEHQGITHVDNTYWKRGSERRMSSPPKGKNAGKSMSKNELLREGLCRLQGRPKAEDIHGSIDVEIGASRQSWKGYLIQSSLVASRGGCGVSHPTRSALRLDAYPS